MKTTLIKGVPLSMQQDGWWLTPPPPSDEANDPKRVSRPLPKHAIALVALIALGDILMWGVTPGLSLAVFGVAVFMFAALLWPHDIAPQRLAVSAGVALLALLPLAELVQPLSLLFFFGGLPVALSLLAGRRPFGALRYWWRGPVFSGASLLQIARNPVPKIDARPLQKVALTWALPVGVGLIFASLLVQANPVLELWAVSLPSMNVQLPSLERMLFWSGLAILLWPALCLVQFAPKLSPDPGPDVFGPRRIPVVINAGSILRSLVIFNLLFVVQNIMDVAVLLGGAGLPEGMSYAEYAHRGAYPLVALALLSGGFALLARPFITAAPVLKTLLVIWVVQTVWLTLSSVARLEMYVDVYGLTRLRIAAAIWMCLVASGLGLILWQILKGLPNLWMIKRTCALGVCALYISCFTSFDATIGWYNLNRAVIADRGYLCDLSEDAIPAILRYSGQSLKTFCRDQYAHIKLSHPDDWREWGFRNARTRRSVAEIEFQQAQP